MRAQHGAQHGSQARPTVSRGGAAHHGAHRPAVSPGGTVEAAWREDGMREGERGPSSERGLEGSEVGGVEESAVARGRASLHTSVKGPTVFFSTNGKRGLFRISGSCTSNFKHLSHVSQQMVIIRHSRQIRMRLPLARVSHPEESGLRVYSCLLAQNLPSDNRVMPPQKYS